MRIIHLARKPLSAGSVASNILEHGTGALNIDACRAGYTSEADLALTKLKNPGKAGELVTSDVYGAGRPQQSVNTQGRWPNNVVLQHLPGCRAMGSRKVKGQNPQYKSKGKGKAEGGVYGDYVEGRPADVGIGHADAEGMETVEAWVCAPGCPVLDLDVQSGVTVSSGGRIGNKDGGHIYGGGKGLAGEFEAGDPGYGDKGGASRFHMVIGGEDG